MIDKTMPFSLKDERENEMKEILTTGLRCAQGEGL